MCSPFKDALSVLWGSFGDSSVNIAKYWKVGQTEEVVLRWLCFNGVFSGHFNQIIHIGQHKPVGPTPKYYTVTQAGNSTWNGRYTVSTATTAKGELVYTSTTCAECSLYASPGSIWRLAIEGKELVYVAASASALPPLSGWTVANGTAPPPVLAAGPV